MRHHFNSFVMLAGMRTGSNLLESHLNTMQGLQSHGELFNQNFMGHPDQDRFMGASILTRDYDPLAFLQMVTDKTEEALTGFRYFHDHDPRVLPQVLQDPHCAKIILTRNPLESYISLKIAQRTSQWRLLSPRRLRKARAEFDITEFITHLENDQAFHKNISRNLQHSGQSAFYLDYEDINDIDVLNGLASFLNVAPLEQLSTRLKKQNPGTLEEKVDNAAEMRTALSQIDYFGQSAPPQFAPLRILAAQNMWASAQAPFLFLPIPGAPEAPITKWMGQFGEVRRGMDIADLRLWRDTHPHHRSFCVIRHPLARAHHAFLQHNLSQTPENRVIHEQIQNILGISLPDIGKAYKTSAIYRQGLLAYMQWLALHLSGQTNLRVGPMRAAQASVIKGFAQVQNPDLIIREARLSEGLAYLCADTNSTAQPPKAEKPSWLLDEIYDAELEAAARAAYGLDYETFGFGNWRENKANTPP